MLLLLEGNARLQGRGDAFIVQLLRQQSLPVQVLLNKWDLVPLEQKMLPDAAYRELLSETDWPVHRCSALSGDGCPELVKAMSSLMPEGPQLYPLRHGERSA